MTNTVLQTEQGVAVGGQHDARAAWDLCRLEVEGHLKAKPAPMVRGTNVVAAVASARDQIPDALLRAQSHVLLVHLKNAEGKEWTKVGSMSDLARAASSNHARSFHLR